MDVGTVILQLAASGVGLEQIVAQTALLEGAAIDAGSIALLETAHQTLVPDASGLPPLLSKDFLQLIRNGNHAAIERGRAILLTRSRTLVAHSGLSSALARFLSEAVATREIEDLLGGPPLLR